MLKARLIFAFNFKRAGFRKKVSRREKYFFTTERTENTEKCLRRKQNNKNHFNYLSKLCVL